MAVNVVIRQPSTEDLTRLIHEASGILEWRSKRSASAPEVASA